MDITVDPSFQARDAFRATVLVTSQPVAVAPAAERRTVWWPLVLVGFVAVTCATIAFLKSPLAQHPAVAPYASALLLRVG